MVNQENFNRNVETIKVLFQGFANGDLDTQMDLYADDIKMNTAQYNGDVLLDKQEIGDILKFFHDNLKDITFHEGVGLKTNQSNGFYPLNDNANLIAVYGTWTPTHIETGKKIFNKYRAVMKFNDAGKIVYASEFWDVSGIQVQLDSNS